MRKRVNNTDPVDQVRLRVMIGNFHGVSHMARLAAGSVFSGSSNHKQETLYVDTNLSYTLLGTGTQWGGYRTCGASIFGARLGRALAFYEDKNFTGDDLVGTEVEELIGANGR